MKMTTRLFSALLTGILAAGFFPAGVGSARTEFQRRHEVPGTG